MRTVFAGGRVFDGTGAAIADADVVVEGERIVEGLVAASSIRSRGFSFGWPALRRSTLS